MERGNESTFLLWIWSFIFIFAPLQLPLLELKNSLLLPFWSDFLGIFFNRKTLIFSDSEGFQNILTLILILAGLSFLLLRKVITVHLELFHLVLNRFLVACLFLIFLKYGLDKIMLLQFPKPEPNLLFTELRHLDKDILFWTSIGTSKLYNFVTGGLEITAALSLLFRRTRRLGLIVLLLSTFYIVLINFSFNIGVKMFSLILLGTLITLSWNTLTFMFSYFLGFGDENEKKIRLYLPILKVILGVSLLAFLFTQNIENTIHNTKQGAYIASGDGALKAIYINQQNYWIEEDHHGNLTSFKILNQGGNSIQIQGESGENFHYEFYHDKGKYLLKGDSYKTQTFQKNDLDNANLNQDSFTWIVR